MCDLMGAIFLLVNCCRLVVVSTHCQVSVCSYSSTLAGEMLPSCPHRVRVLGLVLLAGFCMVFLGVFVGLVKCQIKIQK